MKISDVKSEILAPPDHGVENSPSFVFNNTIVKICTKHIHPQPLFGPSTNIYHIQHTELIFFSHPSSPHKHKREDGINLIEIIQILF
jgi:hypothetical protein